ncbi:TPA: nitroreductase, partial [Candidatus Sumerlaeota bacterium]|nr:nitroreductase [Candidatus Sumerlaeota bacterium]
EQAVDADSMELLIKSRRSVRRYQPVDLEPEVIERLFEVASNAPTARNLRPLLFTVVDKREKLAEIRGEVMIALGKMARTTGFPEGREYFANFVELWEEKQVDVLFRNAPHMVVVSTPSGAITPYIDSAIALSYFEMFAQTLGVGTLWCGLVRWAIDMIPEIKKFLGIPTDHLVAYVMLFGKPAEHYARTVQRGPANVNVVR